MGEPIGQPVDMNADVSTATSGDFLAFGLFIGLLIGVSAWLFHAGGRDARAAALTSFGRAVGTALCAVGMVGYLAAATVVSVGGYGAWSAWRTERAEVAQYRQECKRKQQNTGRSGIAESVERCVAASIQAAKED